MKIKLKRLLLSETTPLVLLLGILMVAGLISLRHYGESWDEFDYLTYAQNSLQAYTGHIYVWDGVYRVLGPSFMMLTILVGKLFPGVLLSDVAHGLSFVTFLIGVAILYKLARRWLGIWESYGATLLFASQPLLWGHAFINPKDTPFMVGFMSSIYFGLRMMDSLKLEQPKKPDVSLKGILGEEWNNLTLLRRLFLAVSLILAIGLSIWLGNLITIWQAIKFPSFFSTAGYSDPQHYLYQITGSFGRLVLEMALSVLTCSLVISISLPATRRYISGTLFKPLARQVKNALADRNLLLMALIVGLTASIRILGLAPIGIVGLLLIWRHHQKALIPLTVLAVLSFLTMYLTWPSIWFAPIPSLLLTVTVMLRFPWTGKVLFDGLYYAPKDLPYFYLPKLISLQTTETALVCFFLGLLVMAYFLFKKQPHLSELAYLSMIWFFIPVLWTVIGNPNLYDNFRQLLFILPPIFIVGGFSLQIIFSKVHLPVIRILVFIILILPGVIGYLRLFPYEYVYYNTLAGSNTFRRYEADYWATSFREASQFINQTSPVHAKVVVWGPLMPYMDYARPDISTVDSDAGPIPNEPYYAVILSRYNDDLSIKPDSPVLFRVERNGMILAVVKYVDKP